ncbi:MAG TPA: terminase family protein [Sphingomicrobium sp.]
MKLPFGPDMALRLARMSPDELRAFIAGCRPLDLLLLDSQFEMWAQKGQLPPQAEGWRVWLMLAGRGFGKTRAGAEWIHALAMTGGKNIALIGATIDEARSVMVEGVSGLIRTARRQRVKIGWEPSKGELRWPKGSKAKLFSGDNPDGLRGPEHHFAWCDELAKWRQAEAAWDNLFMGLRGGMRARALITTTPKPMRLLERLREQEWTVQTGGKTSENINLPKNFVEVMADTYGGTRIGRQELDGELIADVEGALWTKAMIEAARVGPLSLPSPPKGGEGLLRRIVVGVDPPAGSTTGSAQGGDACGIVVCGKGTDGLLYVLEDASVAGLSPEGWANRVAAAAARWGASLIVAEANNGGAMVKSVLDAAEAGVRVKLVHASKGKAARAEPVALRFERGKARLAGDFPELEAELCGLVAGGDYQGPGRSPDRADAMVWALTELGETKSGLPRVVRL